jgi:hypothetical protein
MRGMGDPSARVTSLLRTGVLSATPGGAAITGERWLLRLADGRDVFVKATAEPGVSDFHRREGVIAKALPSTVPSPPLLFALDQGPWTALGFVFAPARLATPDDLPRVLAAATAMAGPLTPAPLRSATRPRLGGFADLAGHGEALARVAPWAAEHLGELIALEAAGRPTWAGDTLLHGDLYPFNALVSPERVYIVDWAHAWVGAAHCDVLMLMAGSPAAAALCAADPLTRDLPPLAIDGFLAAHAGFLLRLALRAEDPHLAAMAAALGNASLRWLSQGPYSVTC